MSVGDQLPKEAYVTNFFEIYERVSLMVYINGLSYRSEAGCLRERTLEGRDTAGMDFSREQIGFIS